METTNKYNCIEKICNLPLNFKVSNKSSFRLLQESGFVIFRKEITNQNIKNYLFFHKNLINNWQSWSEDKRTWGYYLSISPGKYFIGLIDKNGKKNIELIFETDIDACAEFILKEISTILAIE